MEHHSNLVPWQMIAAERSRLGSSHYHRGLLDRQVWSLLQVTRLVAFTHMSNIWAITPARE
jgi:selenocysteine lyase/cysteine desulfurase